ncbi:MAG: glycosyltransferase family 2 protein [Planctomycetes bacterium]|nr:glycosyltransferase family 2 protein [Planctomycetota bacterium]
MTMGIERRASAVLTSFNKRDDVRKNLSSLLAQEEPFAEIIVVDNCSSDGTIAMVREEFPDVTLIVMPDDSYGACETFNIGFATARAPFVAILDDDIELPPDWLKKLFDRFEVEPETTALISTEVIEPGMPESFFNAENVKRVRYMATFRGCGSLARKHVLEKAGYYDEAFFIYGNERDLSSRILNLGYRILQYPEVITKHGTPFGMKKGKRSLYYHTRNFWLYAFKYAPLEDLIKFPFRFVMKRLKPMVEQEGKVSDATGSIGLMDNIRSTPGGFFIVFKATLAAVFMLRHCLKHRQPCTAEDFEMPVF